MADDGHGLKILPSSPHHAHSLKAGLVVFFRRLPRRLFSLVTSLLLPLVGLPLAPVRPAASIHALAAWPAAWTAPV